MCMRCGILKQFFQTHICVRVAEHEATRSQRMTCVPTTRCKEPGTATSCVANTGITHMQKLIACSDKLNPLQVCCLYTLIAASAAAVTAKPTHEENMPWSCNHVPKKMPRPLRINSRNALLVWCCTGTGKYKGRFTLQRFNIAFITGLQSRT